MRWTGFALVLLLALAGCRDEAPAVAAAPAFPGGALVDLTYPFDEQTIYWPTGEHFALHQDTRGMQPGGYYYEANSFRAAEHGGTHLDAPSHFAEGHWHVDAIPLERTIGPAVLVDVSEQAARDRDYRVSVDDFTHWEAKHGRLPEDAIVLLRAGWGKRWPDAERYLGTAEQGAEAVAKLHFSGLDPAAARWLVEQRAIDAIGIDTASIDAGTSTEFESHRTLFAGDVPAFENVAHLDELPETGFFVIALPMKIGGGSGGPLRIVAVVPAAGSGPTD
jgi:kynurenine formamidase